MADTVNTCQVCGEPVEDGLTLCLEHRPMATKPQSPDLPEGIEIPEWAKTGPADLWLRTWIIPEALRRGYKAVWLRATAAHKHYLQPVRLTPEPQKAHITFADPSKTPKVGDSIKSTEVNWDVFPQHNEGHLLLDAVEVRWGSQNAVLFNEEVDLSVFAIQEAFDRLSMQYPDGKVIGDRVVLPDGTELHDELPPDLQQALDTQQACDYGFIKWRLDRGQLYIYNTPDMLKAVGVDTSAMPRVLASDPTIKAIDGLTLLMVSEPNAQERTGYGLLLELPWEQVKEWEDLSREATKDKAPEELAEFIDSLTLKVSNPADLPTMTITDKDGNLKQAGVQPLGWEVRLPTRFSLSSNGLVCAFGTTQYVLKPGGWEEWYNPERTIEDFFQSLPKDEEAPKPEKIQAPQGSNLPDTLPQQTWEEMRVFGYSLADTPTLRYWSLASDSASYLYRRPGERLEVKFDPSALPDLWSSTKPNTPDTMKVFLQERGWKGLLTLHMAANCALTVPDEPIPIDEFVRRLFDVRTAKDRNAKRVWVWETLCAIFNMRLYGLRAGTYKDPETKKVIDLAFRGEPLIAPSPGTRTFPHGQQSLWPDDIPVTIGFTMGKWGKEARKNPKILQYFGDVQAILDIPGGKPSGAWAQCILFNLNQKWREKAKDVSVTTHTRTDGNGKDRKVIATRWPHAFTRRELLVNRFPPDEKFSVENMLTSPNPNRARRTWNEAIKILKRDGRISYYKELTPLDSKRKGWADDWLDQPLDIRPNEEGRKAAIEIKEAHKKALTARKRKPKSGDPKP